MRAPTITANATEETVLKARKTALEDGKTLRAWAGQVIEEKLRTPRAKKRRATK